MVPFLGNIALWLSLFLSFLQFIFSTQFNFSFKIKFNGFIIKALFLSILISFLCLMYCYITSDFSVLNVFQNSHTTKPLLYKVSAVWGNHEGSMLLWILVLVAINIMIYRLYDKKNLLYISKTLQTQSIIIFGFLLFILITSNPFEKNSFIPLNGLGFNPILQDPALAIHPPLLYLGYVGLSAAFSFSVAALTINKINEINWHLYMKSFVVIAWTFLTAGIALGSLWAYYELGWGGWWFWDPVENAALMPWLLSTALLHSIISVEKNQSLQTWVLLLAILAFLLSVIGTFLVRSGILTSVHTFALDPTRGVYILIFITILGAYSLSLYALNANKFLNKKFLSFLSKEGSILVNNLFMAIVCATVLFGTLYPLFVEIFSDKRISVGEPYFNLTVIPIIAPALFIMGIVPQMSWEKNYWVKNIKLFFPSVISTIFSVLLFFIVYKSYNFLGIIGIILASWIFFNVIFVLIKKIKKDLIQKRDLLSIITKNFSSMIIAHLGVSLLILGITGSSIWQKEKIIRMKINDETKIHNYNIVFKKISEIKDSNFLALEGRFTIYNKKNKFIAELSPQNRLYPITNTTTTEVSIHSNPIRDLYLVLGEGDNKNGWIVRIYYNPLVMWIWIGVSIIFIGGLIALKNNLKSIKNINT